MNVDVESDIHNSNFNSMGEKVEAVINELLIKVEAEVGVDQNYAMKDESELFSFINTCDSCSTQDSLFWRRVARTKIVCNRCFFTQTYLLQFKENKSKKTSPVIPHDEQEPIRYIKKTRASFKGVQNLVQSQQIFNCLTESDLKDSTAIANAKSLQEELQMFMDDPMITRKSARFTREKAKHIGKGKGVDKAKKSRNSKSEDPQSDKASPVTSPNSQAVIRALESKMTTNGQKSRRTKIFKSEKSPPIRSQFLTSTIFTSEFVFHRGFFMQVGDIVALFDVADQQNSTPYFAQIRAFLTDQYGAKSAVITWLIPVDSNYSKKIHSPKDFDPDMFVLGPAEEFPRPLDCLEFVCRLIDFCRKIKRNDYFNDSYQFNSDLQRHKFLLNDLADAKLKLITKKSASEQKPVEHEIKWG